MLHTDEVQAAISRDRRTIHTSGRTILNARTKLAELAHEKAQREAEYTGIDSLLALAFVMIVSTVFFCDLFLTGPGVADRFENMGLPPDLAWFLAIGVSTLILGIELIVGTAIFSAYRRGLATGRWFSLVLWSIIGVAVVTISGLFSLSQYLLATENTGAREVKDLALGLVMALGHFVLIGGGRYVLAAKQEAYRLYCLLSVKRGMKAARKAEDKHWQILSDGFRTYLLRLGELSKHVEVPFQMIFFTFERDVVRLLAERFEDQLSLFTTNVPDPLHDAGPRLRSLGTGQSI